MQVLDTAQKLVLRVVESQVPIRMYFDAVSFIRLRPDQYLHALRYM